MHIFISAGEPSGDLHGANLVRHLRQLDPAVACAGFGGDHLEAAGCRLHYPLCRLAVMGLFPVLAHVPTFLRLLSQTDRHFRHRRPDAVVLIDYPGFNWWVARRAHFHGIPVFWFVPPQLWGWAGWRVRKVRRWVDHVLSTLPFEADWFRERGVAAQFVGHPYFDELAGQRLDADFLAAQRARPGPVIGLLPGSRVQEVERNFGMMLRAAARVHAARPDARFLVACYQERLRELVRARLRGSALPVEAHVGRTPEVIELAHSCIAVSGSVGLELLYRGKPTVVVYRVTRPELALCGWFQAVPYISLVNLLAGEELFPEFLTDRCAAAAVGDRVRGWLEDAAAHAALRRRLAELRGRVAAPGACERAARFIRSALAGPGVRSRRAA